VDTVQAEGTIEVADLFLLEEPQLAAVLDQSATGGGCWLGARLVTHGRLKADQGGLEFFAIWCPHCQNEAPILNQIDAAFAPKGERTVSILASPYGRDYDTSGGTNRRLADRGDLSWFDTTFKVQHTTLIDPSFAVVNRYGANSYPTIYVVDSSSTIRFAQAGDVAYQDLANALTQLH